MSQLQTATTVARRTPAKGGQQRELRVLTAADATGSPLFPMLVVALPLASKPPTISVRPSARVALAACER